MTLEQFRKATIEEIKKNKKYIKKVISDVIHEKFKVYIHGSVLSKSQFNENSDIDLAVVINNPKLEIGPNEFLTKSLRDRFINYPFDFGILDIIVFNNKVPNKISYLI